MCSRCCISTNHDRASRLLTLLPLKTPKKVALNLKRTVTLSGNAALWLLGTSCSSTLLDALYNTRWVACGCQSAGRGSGMQRLQKLSQILHVGNGLTLNVDMAGSLLYLSMVWNLDEWLSSWYSSECLLRVCITFWKGREEGTAKKNEPNRKKSKSK